MNRIKYFRKLKIFGANFVGEGKIEVTKFNQLGTPSNFNNSLVLNTLTEDWFLNLGSLDQMEQFNLSANAKYGVSLSDLCGEILPAFDSNSLYSSDEEVLINSPSSTNVDSTCDLSDSVYLTKSRVLRFNSSREYFGENSSKLSNLEFIIINLTGLSRKNENKILASTTRFIHQPSALCLFQTRSFNSSPSFKQSSSVSLEFSSILSSFFNINALLVFSERNFLTDSDQFISGNASIFSFKSSGTDNVIFGIFLPPQNYVKAVKAVGLYKLFYVITFAYECLVGFEEEVIEPQISQIGGIDKMNGMEVIEL